MGLCNLIMYINNRIDIYIYEMSVGMFMEPSKCFSKWVEARELLQRDSDINIKARGWLHKYHLPINFGNSYELRNNTQKKK